MAKVDVNVQVKKIFWFVLLLRILVLLARVRIVPVHVAKRWLLRVAQHGIMYRVNQGSWQKFESPLVHFDGGI